MDIQIIESNNETLKVIIKCRQVNDKVLRLKSHIELFDQKILAKGQDESFVIEANDVLYFEAFDDRTFLYTIDNVLEVKLRLYELESFLSEKDFIRISKSHIVNINKITKLKPELNRTLLLTLCDGEQLSVSRNYVKQFKELLSIGVTK
ncbi:MAG TPA: LytTR family transcriptional regulator [Anaerolineaceae bacterium]|nr:LytTR family transcriptional regulator [Anaerolineaceae bacterium]